MRVKSSRTQPFWEGSVHEYVLGRSSTIFLDKIFGLAKCPFLGRSSFVQKVNILCFRLSFRSVSSYLDRQEPHSTESSFSQPKRVDANTKYSHHHVCMDANIGGRPGL
ncbi:hypothetical protein SLA2020_286380 [Shorea laevis]